MLALTTDSLSARPGVVALRRGSTRVVVRWRPSTTPTVEWTGEQSGARHVVRFEITATEALTYDIEIHNAADRR